MDNAVALVQAFLRLHGYLTVTEFPVVQRARHGGQECLTDLDVLAFRFGTECDPIDHGPPEGAHGAGLLGITADTPDMIIGEVKEGRAELNAAATKHDVLAAALARFGCCPPADTHRLATELLRHGRAKTRHGHAVRLVAFGSLPPGHHDPRCHVVLLADVVSHLREYITAHWEAMQASASKDPAIGMLLTLEKAARSTHLHGRSPGRPHPRAEHP